MNLFIDIETIGDTSIDQWVKDIFVKKHCTSEWDFIDVNKLWVDYMIKSKWWLHAEFWKIVCVSIWRISDDKTYRFKSFVWVDEKKLLEDFITFISKYTSITRVWHNIKWFDLPFIVKRLRINWLKVPPSLDFINKKPREINAVDTMEVWRWTGWFNNNASLDLICRVLWIDTPKDNWDWWMVAQWYKDWKLDTISHYCEWDVRATIDVFMRLQN